MCSTRNEYRCIHHYVSAGLWWLGVDAFYQLTQELLRCGAGGGLCAADAGIYRRGRFCAGALRAGLPLFCPTAPSGGVLLEFYPDGNTMLEEKKQAPPVDICDWDFKTLLGQAEAGNPAAQHHLGCLCDLEPDGAEEAVAWWRKAAEQGYAASMNDLGAAYEAGSGVEQDLQQALVLYRCSAEQGDCQAMANLGRVYEYGIGVPADKVLMLQWYRRAAERNSSEAQNRLGYCYDQGDGVVQNAALAAYWFGRAAHLNDPLAQYNLACCYELGIGVPEDAARALHWYTKAVESGNADALWRMGVAYRDGDFGLKPDKAEARRLLEQAPAQALERAEQALEELI